MYSTVVDLRRIEKKIRLTRKCLIIFFLHFLWRHSLKNTLIQINLHVTYLNEPEGAQMSNVVVGLPSDHTSSIHVNER
jgi:hypothetical protein